MSERVVALPEAGRDELLKPEYQDSALLAALSAVHPPQADIARAMAAARGTPVYWRHAPKGLMQAETVIDLCAMDAQAAAQLERFGLAAPLLEALFADVTGFGMEGGIVPVIEEDSRRHAEMVSAESRGSFGMRRFMHPFFQAGGLVAWDPGSGARLVSTHSFLFDHLHIAYRFSGMETFYVVVGGIGGQVRFVCFPRLNCLVLGLVSGETEGHKEWSRGLYRHLMLNILAAGDAFADAVRHPRRAGGICVGTWPNLGHYIWQELAGTEEVLRTHGSSAIRHIITGKHANLPIKDVFPELADTPELRVDDPPDGFPLTFHLPFQHIRPVHAVISRSLRARIFALAERRVTAERQAEMERRRAEGFIFWITLRSHNKAWVQQVTGYARVIAQLARTIPGLTVLFDGWTDTREVAAAIRQRIDPAIPVIDTIGCSLYETFLWARSIHLYAAVVSTGLHFPSHFGDRPGVAHGNVQHLRQRAFWGQLSPGTIAPVLLEPEEVRDVEDGSLYDGYDFPPELLAARLLDVARRHYPDRVN